MDAMAGRRRSTTVAALAMMSALSLAGCTESDPSTVESPSTTSSGAPRPVLDWVTHAPVDLGGGWSVSDTEGDGPLVTVRNDGMVVGLLEYLDFPIEARAASERATLDAHVAAYLRDIGADRAQAPVKGYRFDPDAATHLEAADGAVVRYGFRGTMPDGAPSERTIQWAGIRNDRLVLVSAAANDPGGLFPPEGTAFTSAQLDEVGDRLERLVLASGLPEPAGA